jgi:hypothetical protein
MRDYFCSSDLRALPHPTQRALYNGDHATTTTLSDMDAEITTLEGKLSKPREVKAGMMSVLLSGRIRLVES